jgi:TRAP-type C4-dicarboxylate transport system permease small subunit
MEKLFPENNVRITWPEHFIFVLAMCSVVFLGVIVTTTIISRWLGHPLIPDDVLIVQELMIGVIILPLAYVTASNGHIAVTVFTRKMGVQITRKLDVVGHIFGLVFITGLFLAGADMFYDAWESEDYYDGDLNFPKWIGHGLYALGLLALIIRQGALFIRSVLPLEQSKDEPI